MTKAVAVKSANPLAAFMDDDDTRHGGKINAADLSLPFLRVLQGLSPQLNRDSPSYLKGASAGDICLTVLDRFWDREDGVSVIFCHYSRVFVEWRPTDVGGGIVNTYPPEHQIVGSATRGDKGALILPNGNVLVETAYHAVLVDVDGKWVRAVLPMKSTMLKISRKLNNVLTSFELPNSKGIMKEAPRWVRGFLMTSVNESKMGNTWAVPVFEVMENADGSPWLVSTELYGVAKQWAIAADKSTNFAASEAAQTPKGNKPDIEDEAPF